MNPLSYIVLSTNTFIKLWHKGNIPIPDDPLTSSRNGDNFYSELSPVHHFLILTMRALTIDPHLGPFYNFILIFAL